MSKTPKAPDDAEKSVAFEQGRTAYRARIAKDDAPHGEGPLLKAWLKGYEFEADADTAAR